MFRQRRTGLLVSILRIEKLPKKIYNPPEIKDLVIDETHIRDILAKAPVNISDQERKGFVGFNQMAAVRKLLSEKLGANAVELQPTNNSNSRKKMTTTGVICQ